jgi:hypothetical protein
MIIYQRKQFLKRPIRGAGLKVFRIVRMKAHIKGILIVCNAPDALQRMTATLGLSRGS